MLMFLFQNPSALLVSHKLISNELYVPKIFRFGVLKKYFLNLN